MTFEANVPSGADKREYAYKQVQGMVQNGQFEISTIEDKCYLILINALLALRRPEERRYRAMPSS
jgi:hypothetical protein